MPLIDPFANARNPFGQSFGRDGFENSRQRAISANGLGSVVPQMMRQTQAQANTAARHATSNLTANPGLAARLGARAGAQASAQANTQVAGIQAAERQRDYQFQEQARLEGEAKRNQMIGLGLNIAGSVGGMLLPGLGQAVNAGQQLVQRAATPQTQAAQARPMGTPPEATGDPLRDRNVGMPGIMNELDFLLSDEDAKEDIREAARAIDVFLSQINPQSFNYRNPQQRGARPGRQTGVMAQDLERSEVGRQMVTQNQQGQRMVDPQAAIGTLLAAQARLNQRLQAIENPNARITGVDITREPIPGRQGVRNPLVQGVSIEREPRPLNISFGEAQMEPDYSRLTPQQARGIATVDNSPPLREMEAAGEDPGLISNTRQYQNDPEAFRQRVMRNRVQAMEAQRQRREQEILRAAR